MTLPDALTYDEPLLVSRLQALSREQRTAFAAACAQRLLPLFERYVQATGRPGLEEVRAAIEASWRASSGEAVAVDGISDAVEAVLPARDDPWVRECGYGEDAGAAAAYAVRAWVTDDAQEAAWAARKVYEAADYAAQALLPELSVYSAEIDRAILEHPAVQTALAGIHEDLQLAAGADPVVMRERAEAAGSEWAASLP